MKTFRNAIAAVLCLAHLSHAATTLADPATASQDSSEAGAGGGFDTDGTTQLAVAAMKLEPTSCNVPNYDDIIIDTLTFKVDTSAAQDGSTSPEIYGLQYLIPKWRGWAAGAGALPNSPNASPGSGTGGAAEVTTLSAAGTQVWQRQWAAVLSFKSGSDKKYLNGLSFKGCALTAATNATDGSTCATVVTAAAGNYAALAAGEKEIGAYTNLVGPIVSFTAVGTAQIWKLKAQVVSNLCLNAKIVVTAGWTATTAAAQSTDSGAATLSGAISESTLAAGPRHNMDVPGWTQCVIHFACAASNADDCAGTATTVPAFPKTRATLAAGKAVKVVAFISTNLWYAQSAATYGAEGTWTVTLYANCAWLTTVTAPAAAALAVTPGKTATAPAAFTHNKSALWAPGLCGEAVTVTGDKKAWVAWAAGVATVTVPADAKAGVQVVTLTAAYATGESAGSANTASTATGTMKLTLTVAAGAGGAGAGAGGVADVAATAAAVVAGVLGGTVFAAAFLPSPPTPSAPAAGAGAAAQE